MCADAPSLPSGLTFAENCQSPTPISSQHQRKVLDFDTPQKQFTDKNGNNYKVVEYDQSRNILVLGDTNSKKLFVGPNGCEKFSQEVNENLAVAYKKWDQRHIKRTNNKTKKSDLKCLCLSFTFQLISRENITQTQSNTVTSSTSTPIQTQTSQTQAAQEQEMKFDTPSQHQSSIERNMSGIMDWSQSQNSPSVLTDTSEPPPAPRVRARTISQTSSIKDNEQDLLYKIHGRLPPGVSLKAWVFFQMCNTKNKYFSFCVIVVDK